MPQDSDHATNPASNSPLFSVHIASSFQARFLALNHIDGFRAWTFYPGMLFRSVERWWGGGGERAAPHEGIDLCFYSNVRGESLTVQSGMEVPSPYDGFVVSTVDDFIGQSVFMRHTHLSKPGFHLYTLFGHTEPQPNVKPGSEIKEGHVIAKIADAHARHRRVQSHLHITQAWIDDTMPFEAIVWERITDKRIVLIDPLTVLRLAHVVQETQG